MARLYISNKDETVRMFGSDFLESFSHSHPLTAWVLYVPVVVLCVYWSFWHQHLSVLTISEFLVVGLLIWTLFEYLMHRYVFHFEAESRLARRFHFIAHGSHHEHPNDVSRMATPPVVSLPVAALLYLMSALIFGRFGQAVGAGLGLGYIAYETIHYASHHFKMKRAILRGLKKNHLAHHYQDDHAGYGVSSPLWDYVFGAARKISPPVGVRGSSGPQDVVAGFKSS
jgi:4-hydroxysphinganine ceramide fatty acyl 2-hydroxylase